MPGSACHVIAMMVSGLNTMTISGMSSSIQAAPALVDKGGR
jgi:hypothetical protein